MKQLVLKNKNEMTKGKKKKGFTLIELIIVIAIIAILAALAIPKFGAVRENANQKADIATAKNMATAVAQELASDDTIDSTHEITSDVIGDKIDGSLKPKANSAASFTYKIEGGNISIYYTGTTTKVYPQE